MFNANVVNLKSRCAKLAEFGEKLPDFARIRASKTTVKYKRRFELTMAHPGHHGNNRESSKR
jgi:hypothetical protein